MLKGRARELALRWMAARRYMPPPLSRLVNSHRAPACNVLLRAPKETSPTSLALRHSHRWVFCMLRPDVSTSLRSLRSIPVTGFPRYYGRSDSCPAGSSVAWWQHEHRLCPEQVSLIHILDLPIPPSPTTRPVSHRRFYTLPFSSLSFPFPGPGFAIRSQARQSLVGRIAFLIVRMDHSPHAAPHPTSR